MYLVVIFLSYLTYGWSYPRTAL